MRTEHFLVCTRRVQQENVWNAVRKENRIKHFLLAGDEV